MDMLHCMRNAGLWCLTAHGGTLASSPRRMARKSQAGEVMGDGRLDWRVDGCSDRDDWLRRGECEMIRVSSIPSTTACIKPWIKRP